LASLDAEKTTKIKHIKRNNSCK